MRYKTSISILGVSLLLAGCASDWSMENTRPDLFHPQTARNVKRLEHLKPQAVQATGEPSLVVPSEAEEICDKCTVATSGDLMPGGSDVWITFTNEGCPSGQSPTLAIAEGGNSVGAMTSNGTSASLIIDATSLAGNFVTLAFTPCGQSGTIRKRYPVKVPPVKIVGPQENKLVKSQTYKISVYDECPVGGNPDVRFEPPDAGSFASHSGNYWDYLIDTSKSFLTHGSNIHVSAQSCRASKDSPVQLKNIGLLKKEKYLVEDPAYQGIAAKLVIWSYEDTANEFGKVFAESFYAADAVFVNRSKESMLVYGSSLTAWVRFLAANKDVEKIYKGATKDPSILFMPKEGEESIADRINWKESWRPMSFSDVLAIFTYQQEGAPLKRTMERLKALGVLLTGATVFTPGIDYVKGVAFFTGVFNPALEKELLWDVLLHVKNIEARALKEVEEIPPNGQLRKAVFFPRRAIYGVLPEIPVYISEIRPDPANVLFTVVEKKETIEAKSDE